MPSVWPRSLRGTRGAPYQSNPGTKKNWAAIRSVDRPRRLVPLRLATGLLDPRYDQATEILT